MSSSKCQSEPTSSNNRCGDCLWLRRRRHFTHMGRCPSPSLKLQKLFRLFVRLVHRSGLKITKISNFIVISRATSDPASSSGFGPAFNVAADAAATVVARNTRLSIVTSLGNASMSVGRLAASFAILLIGSTRHNCCRPFRWSASHNRATASSGVCPVSFNSAPRLARKSK